MGTDSLVDVTAGGEALELHGELDLVEDLRSGCRLRFQFGSESASHAEPGKPVRLRVRTSDAHGAAQEASFLLWCRELATERDGATATSFVEATDPLELSSVQRELVTHPGRLQLAKLVDRILSRQPGRLEELHATEDSGQEVPQDWLLQCDESGREFLSRIARSLGRLVFWNREAHAQALVGRGRTQEPESIRLELGADLIRVRSVRAPDVSPQRIFWTDPASRAVHVSSVQGRGVSGSGAVVLSGRLVSGVQPNEAACSERVVWPRSGEFMVLETIRPDIALGAPLLVPDEAPMLATRIEHHMHAQGSYQNRVFCVPRERWGAGEDGPRSGRAFVLQAEVSHNDDPQGQQRIRVILSEDSERRSSPWIPVVTPSAGAGRGVFWVPEVGDLVLVLGVGESPESLVCVGALRGSDQRVDGSWKSAENEWKVLAGRDGVAIRVNDRQGSIRIETPSSAIELGRDGRIRMSGKTLDVDMDSDASVRAGRTVLLNADRIDLGL